MKRKVKVCITIDSEVLEVAKEHITYLSRYIETCLRRANAKHNKENSKIENKSETYQSESSENISEETRAFYANLED